MLFYEKEIENLFNILNLTFCSKSFFDFNDYTKEDNNDEYWSYMCRSHQFLLSVLKVISVVFTLYFEYSFLFKSNYKSASIIA